MKSIALAGPVRLFRGASLRSFFRGGMMGYQYFNCGAYAVSWDADFDFEDYGLEGDGIIHECHCNNCGARITYEIPINDDDD